MLRYTRFSFPLALLIFFGVADANAASEKVVEVTGAPYTQIRFAYTPHAHPAAHVLLLPGGRGDIGISDGFFGVRFGRYARHGSFTINTRKRFASHGFSVAVVDMPVDWQPQRYYRESEEHGENIRAVINRMKQDADVPVWLIGHSRGTIAAVAQTINLGKEVVQGVVLSASIAAGREVDTYVPDMPLDFVYVTALVMSAANDLCDEYTPKEAAVEIGARMVNSPKVKVHYIEGAKHHSNSELVCKTNSAHSYGGIENDVADFVAGFIKENL